MSTNVDWVFASTVCFCSHTLVCAPARQSLAYLARTVKRWRWRDVGRLPGCQWIVAVYDKVHATMQALSHFSYHDEVSLGVRVRRVVREDTARSVVSVRRAPLHPCGV